MLFWTCARPFLGVFAVAAHVRYQWPVPRPCACRATFGRENMVFFACARPFSAVFGVARRARSGSGATGRLDRDAAAAARTGCFGIIGSADGRFWLPRRHAVRHVNVSRPNRFRPFRPFPRASPRFPTLTAGTMSPALSWVFFSRVGGRGGLTRPYLGLGHVQRPRVLTSLARGRLPLLSM